MYTKRTHLKMSQERLAALVGVDRSYISRVENGNKSPNNFFFLQKCADFLQLSAAESLAFFEAAQASKRLIRMPETSTPIEYEVVAKLVHALPALNDFQLTYLRTTIEALVGGVTGKTVRFVPDEAEVTM